jgi:hypothetical protein
MPGIMPDLLRPGLRLVVCGTAAGRASAARAGNKLNCGASCTKSVSPHCIAARRLRTVAGSPDNWLSTSFCAGRLTNLSSLSSRHSGASARMREKWQVHLITISVGVRPPGRACLGTKRIVPVAKHDSLTVRSRIAATEPRRLGICISHHHC